MLIATGGTPPYVWSVASGTLPSGLGLNATSGTLSGTPTTAALDVPLSFEVQDAGNPAQRATVSLPLSIGIAPADVTLSVSPRRAALVAGQTVSLTATTNDPAGVTWSASPSGGSFTSLSSASGARVAFTAPDGAGVYHVTATSVTNTARSGSVTVAVTDLPGIYTYHDDLARDGVNSREYALTPSDVNTHDFGKLFSCKVDGAIYAQPLWVANLRVNGAIHNVVFVATAHDGLFAFDADTSPCVTLWAVSLIDGAHGGYSGETPVSTAKPGYLVGEGIGDIVPEVGVIGTPVIDPATRTLYVVSKSVDATKMAFHQRLHAIDLATGDEKPGSPVAITATYPGAADGGTTDTFDPRQQNQRAGLALVNGTVYVAWGSHENAAPYCGWIIGYSYDGTSITQTHVLDVTPDAGRGGIWMSGAAPAADPANDLYLITGDGTFDAVSPTAPNDDFGDSYLKLSSTLSVLDYFTPSAQAVEAANDKDFGSGGAAVLADLPPGSPIPHLAIGGSKDGYLYVLNRSELGGYGDGNALQKLYVGGSVHSSGAYWNGNFYMASAGAPLSAYHIDTSTSKLSLSTTSIAPAAGFGYPGAIPSVSAVGDSNAIVWALDTSQYCTSFAPGCGPAVLHAYDANDIADELWNSATEAADAAGNAVKFAVPTIANGKVYIGTRGNNTGGPYASTSRSGELDVYGLNSG